LFYHRRHPTSITTGTESPATTSSPAGAAPAARASIDCNNYAADDYYCGGLFAAAAHGGVWTTEPFGGFVVVVAGDGGLDRTDPVTGARASGWLLDRGPAPAADR